MSLPAYHRTRVLGHLSNVWWAVHSLQDVAEHCGDECLADECTDIMAWLIMRQEAYSAVTSSSRPKHYTPLSEVLKRPLPGQLTF